MKFFIITALLSFTIVSAQNISVLEDIPLTKLAEGEFYYPSLSPNGNGIIFSSENYKGLWYKDISQNKITKLSEFAGAGYNANFDATGEKVIFKTDNFVSKRKYSSLKILDLNTLETSVIEKDTRDLKLRRKLGKDWCIYLKDGDLRKEFINKITIKNYEDEVSAFIEKNKIIIFVEGKRRELAPLGKQNYIWPSISPDQSKLLFTAPGKGTFISDLDGNILVELGYANSPSWSPDGEWILFMEDFDDGVRITNSELCVIKSNGSEKTYLTDTENIIEMYPKWGNSKTEIIYNTLDGQIRKMNLEFN